MSTIKANTLTVKCGSTLTLGESGKTVTIASGASTSGMGRTGTVNWVTTKKTANFTAVSGGAYIGNTTDGAFTMTLPANPNDNDYVIIADGFGKWDIANLTIARNGNNIAGEAADLIGDAKYASVRLVFKTTPDVTSSFIGWVIT